jgi:CBS domain-containing protein
MAIEEDSMQVRDVMTPEVRCASPDATLSEIAALMKRLDVGAIPLCGAGGQVIGMITDRDITVQCVAAGLNPQEYRAREFMTAEPITISADAPIGEALRVMGQERVHRLPVVEEGRLVGIVSASDLAVKFSDNHSIADLFRHLSEPVRTAPTHIHPGSTQSHS